MPVQIEKRRLLLQYCAKAAALFRYDLDKTKSPVSSYSDAICFCANTLTYGDFIRESGSDPSKPHEKLVLHPDCFQVFFRFLVIYNCTILASYRCFSVYSCNVFASFRFILKVFCRNIALSVMKLKVVNDFHESLQKVSLHLFVLANIFSAIHLKLA